MGKTARRNGVHGHHEYNNISFGNSIDCYTFFSCSFIEFYAPHINRMKDNDGSKPDRQPKVEWVYP